MTPPPTGAELRAEFDRYAADSPEDVEAHGSIHAAAIDRCFPPPESYEDPWLARIFDLYDFVVAAPCTCTPEQAAEPWDKCPRCTLLNEHGAGR